MYTILLKIMQMPGHTNMQFISGYKAAAEAAQNINLSQSSATTSRVRTTDTTKNTPMMTHDGHDILPKPNHKFKKL